MASNYQKKRAVYRSIRHLAGLLFLPFALVLSWALLLFVVRLLDAQVLTRLALGMASFVLLGALLRAMGSLRALSILMTGEHVLAHTVVARLMHFRVFEVSVRPDLSYMRYGHGQTDTEDAIPQGLSESMNGRTTKGGVLALAWKTFTSVLYSMRRLTAVIFRHWLLCLAIVSNRHSKSPTYLWRLERLLASPKATRPVPIGPPGDVGEKAGESSVTTVVQDLLAVSHWPIALAPFFLPLFTLPLVILRVFLSSVEADGILFIFDWIIWFTLIFHFAGLAIEFRPRLHDLETIGFLLAFDLVVVLNLLYLAILVGLITHGVSAIPEFVQVMSHPLSYILR